MHKPENIYWSSLLILDYTKTLKLAVIYEKEGGVNQKRAYS